MSKQNNTVFIRVDYDLEKIKRLLKMAVDRHFNINGGKTISKYTKECGHKMLNLAFDGSHALINFNTLELTGKEKIITEDEFPAWLTT